MWGWVESRKVVEKEITRGITTNPEVGSEEKNCFEILCFNREFVLNHSHFNDEVFNQEASQVA